jgi:uncharacterized protein (TIGR02265 family)
VVYAHTVKALISRVFERRGLLNPITRAELLGLGVDLARPRDLPIALWWKVVGLAARELAPGADGETAYFKVGCEMIRGFEASVLGKTVFLVFRTLGIRRAMMQLADSYRTADTVTHVASRAIGTHQVEVTFRVDGGVPHPAYTRGILLTGLELVGAREPTVSYTVQPDGAMVYLSGWAER